MNKLHKAIIVGLTTIALTGCNGASKTANTEPTLEELTLVMETFEDMAEPTSDIHNSIVGVSNYFDMDYDTTMTFLGDTLEIQENILTLMDMEISDSDMEKHLEGMRIGMDSVTDGSVDKDMDLIHEGFDKYSDNFDKFLTDMERLTDEVREEQMN